MRSTPQRISPGTRVDRSLRTRGSAGSTWIRPGGPKRAVNSNMVCPVAVVQAPSRVS